MREHADDRVVAIPHNEGEVRRPCGDRSSWAWWRRGSTNEEPERVRAGPLHESLRAASRLGLAVQTAEGQ